MDKKEKPLGKKTMARFLMRDEVNEAISDELLDFNFDLIEAEVLRYCNRIDFPTGLMLIVIKMVLNTHKQTTTRIKSLKT